MRFKSSRVRLGKRKPAGNVSFVSICRSYGAGAISYAGIYKDLPPTGPSLGARGPPQSFTTYLTPSIFGVPLPTDLVIASRHLL
jgi:hypothetical protein